MPEHGQSDADVKHAEDWSLRRLQEIVDIWRECPDWLVGVADASEHLAAKFLEAIRAERQNTMEEVGTWHEPSPPGR